MTTGLIVRVVFCTFMRRAYPPKLTVKADVANWQPWAIFSRRAPSPLAAAYPQIASVLDGCC